MCRGPEPANIIYIYGSDLDVIPPAVRWEGCMRQHDNNRVGVGVGMGVGTGWVVME